MDVPLNHNGRRVRAVGTALVAVRKLRKTKFNADLSRVFNFEPRNSRAATRAAPTRITTRPVTPASYTVPGAPGGCGRAATSARFARSRDEFHRASRAG